VLLLIGMWWFLSFSCLSCLKVWLCVAKLRLLSTFLLLQAFPLLIAGRVPLLLPSPASLFIYSSMRHCPSPPLWHSGCPTLFITCLFFSFQLLVYYSVCFFSPGWESVYPGGYADLAQGCLWEYHMLLSSPGGLLLPRRLGTGIWQHGSPPGFSI
jgi:hypothetical protein